MIIEKNIPVPGASTLMLSSMIKMEVGDSFLIGNVGVHVRSNMQRLKNHPSLLGRKFITRKIGADLRVWRVA